PPVEPAALRELATLRFDVNRLRVHLLRPCLAGSTLTTSSKVRAVLIAAVAARIGLVDFGHLRPVAAPITLGDVVHDRAVEPVFESLPLKPDEGGDQEEEDSERHSARVCRCGTAERSDRKGESRDGGCYFGQHGKPRAENHQKS